ncbi:MAG: pyruvate, phosphate dikinase [Chloroflexi bacterium]|nr:MAG: pyruvate, phosphate dikinase [Chloroflexota bacterium]
MAKKWVYMFSEGSEKMRNLLGGKGAGLAEMTRAGLPVPPGFTITTEACNEYFKHNKQFPEGMWEQTLEALKKVEEMTGKKFGDPKNPLLVSVRSGARVSMPGMMDTVLNLGLNEETLKGLAELTQNERFAYDAYRRFIQMFGRIVMKVPGEKFDEAFERIKKKYGAKQDTDLDAEALKEVVAEFKKIYKEHVGEDFPEDPYEQLRKAIAAVFDSWFGKRAVDYRNFHGIPHDWGTAVNVVTMVFGNMGDDSGTGVAFTRDPATGEKILWGEYLPNAQGEDVVAGIRTPMKIHELKEQMPEVYKQFVKVAELLEKHYRDMQDLEFTVERGKLWMLQTRTGKRTAKAAVKIAVDMVNEGIISKEEAIMRVTPEQVDQLLHPRFDEKAKDAARSEGRFLAKGLNASPGAATGIAVFDADTAEKLGKEGESVILVRPETSPDDVHGMLQAKGILTQHGGATSHAAVVARGLGKPCVAGCEAIRIDLSRRLFSVNGHIVKEGDVISIDGSTGEVFIGAIPTIEPKLEEEKELLTLLSWADEIRKLGVWANADYPRDAQRARAFGAQGIGLCRTEHMFFEEDRLPIVHQMILAETKEEREAALEKLLPIQREDFKGILKAMEGLPVIIRLIDPPLHEFLPKYEELVSEVAELRTRIEYEGEKPELKAKLAEKETLLRKVAAMREANPMLGFRGVRLGILWPEINKMQVRAILEAACELTKEGVEVHPEIMIPVTANANELKIMRELLEEVAKQVMEEQGVTVDYKFGTMIEIPRAALTADEFAKYAEFFSFGTNDLTQTVYGISRDDAEGKFLLQYVEKGIIPANPFQVLDRDGVGKIMKMCVEAARKVRPDIEIGICGEHGGDPESIEFCHILGLNYVSCSPFRVPIARLAAAQAALKHKYGRE